MTMTLADFLFPVMELGKKVVIPHLTNNVQALLLCYKFCIYFQFFL